MSVVRLIAVNKMYRTVPYFAVPVYDEEKREWRPTKADCDEIAPIKVRLDYEPDDQFPLTHQMSFDKNKPEDVFLLALAKLQPVIAPSKRDVVSTKHLFYLEDVEAEAEVSISKVDRIFEALSLVKENSSVGSMRDLAIYLGFNPGDSLKVLQSHVYSFIENDPDTVLSFFKNSNLQKLLVKKAIHYGILKNRGGLFYDGERLIGRDEAEVELFVMDEKNAPLVGKWSLAIDRYEGKKLPETSKSNIPLKSKKPARATAK